MSNSVLPYKNLPGSVVPSQAGGLSTLSRQCGNGDRQCKGANCSLSGLKILRWYELIYDCQSMDFIGFMGAVVLLVGKLPNSAESSSDNTELLNRTIHVLRRIAMNSTNQIAYQCGNILTTLLALCLSDKQTESTVPSTIRIPYFDILQVKPKAHNELDIVAVEEQQTPFPVPIDRGRSVADGASGEHNSHAPTEIGTSTIAYQGTYNLDLGVKWGQCELGEMLDNADSMATLDNHWSLVLNSNYPMTMRSASQCSTACSHDRLCETAP